MFGSKSREIARLQALVDHLSFAGFELLARAEQAESLRGYVIEQRGETDFLVKMVPASDLEELNHLYIDAKESAETYSVAFTEVDKKYCAVRDNVADLRNKLAYQIETNLDLESEFVTAKKRGDNLELRLDDQIEARHQLQIAYNKTGCDFCA